jgi:hypothetical protein
MPIRALLDKFALHLTVYPGEPGLVHPVILHEYIYICIVSFHVCAALYLDEIPLLL